MLDYTIKQIVKKVSSHDIIIQSSRAIGIIGLFLAFILSFINLRSGLQNFVTSIILILIFLIRSYFLKRFVMSAEQITAILEYSKRSYLFRLFTWLEYSYEYKGLKYRFRGYVFDPSEDAKYIEKGETFVALLGSKRPDKPKIVGRK